MKLSDYVDTSKAIEFDSAAIGLKYFGYDVFRQFPENFMQLQVGPVDLNYVIGPGDEIILSMWGDTELRYSLPVERDGTIYIEKAGQIVVNGYTVEGLQKRLEKVLSKYYSTIKPVKGKPTTFIDVGLGKLRPILIYVIGEVYQPGAYPLDAFSTVFGSLLISGGPAYSGSLRNIQVIRNNKIVANFDLYEFLLTGKKEGDIRLRNDDIVFVPYRSNTIYLNGEVRDPAIYELKSAETLKELVYYAKGLDTKADLERVQIERLVPFGERDSGKNENRIVIDEKLGKLVDGKFVVNSIKLQDQDSVTVFTIFDKLKRYVTINGAVFQPGKYSFDKARTLGELINDAQGLLPEAYERVVHIKRTLPDYNIELIAVDISNQDELSTELLEWDEVKIYSIWDIKYKDIVKIHGEVRNPGEFPLYKGATLKDIIIQAGGFTKVAYEHEVEVFRADPVKASQDMPAVAYKVKVTGDLLNSKINDDGFILSDRDEIVVRSIPYFKYQQNVSILGEVKFPGNYSLIKKDETLTDLVKRAGGLTAEAFPAGISFTRNGQKLVADFDNILKGRKKENIGLLENDEIVVPKHPQTVEVVGLVNNPGFQKYVKGTKVNKYIEQAGGYHRDADKGEVFVYYADGKAKQYRKLFMNNVTEGSKIIVGRKEQREPLDVTEFLKELASITASVVTVIILVTRIG